METSLHRQLKLHYAGSPAQTEVCVEGFRIDALAADGELIEIQHASLGALRDKTRRLLAASTHSLRIVKPIIACKRVITLTCRDGEIKRSRMSPKRCEAVDVFNDLVHFCSVFPRQRLTLEIALIEAEEIRLDRVRPTRRGKRFVSLDQQLVRVVSAIQLRTLGDLLAQLPLADLPKTFDTAQLAGALGRPRWFAQKVAYCLRETGAVTASGKQGNSRLYRVRPGAWRQRSPARRRGAA